jgi:hypothetical protein
LINLLFAVLVFLTYTKEPERDQRIYLSAVLNQKAISGAQDETKGLYYQEYKPGYIAHLNTRWDTSEPEPGTYLWDKQLDKGVENLKQQKALVIIGTRASPKWARLHPTQTCSQPMPSKYADYGKFILAIINRYKPYGIELWNEPDIKPAYLPKDWWIMGCWDSGRDYADMLRVVYPMVKEKYPNVTVIAGALMLNGHKVFTELWLRGKAYDFDWLSFHAYTYLSDNVDYGFPIEKIEYLQNFDTGKALYMSETAILSWDSICNPTLEAEKVNYINVLKRYAADWGIAAWSWYTVGSNGWKCSDLAPGIPLEAWKP